eukprot:gb/GEZN01003961.1/.p1 GENE.gb/GEZN01003961.1/~~gb/GEZN01003961.1/.p1  ORF type:complete len:561 (-),score=91.83 gb/GEZN01003961.1/:324-2006(-)
MNGTEEKSVTVAEHGDHGLQYMEQCLSVVVVGASGDLAKKKTYPALYALFLDKNLPKRTTIWGYARSEMTDKQLRDKLRPYLEKETKHKAHSKQQLGAFLELLCVYRQGDYDSKEHLQKLVKGMEKTEKSTALVANRLYYFAVPPFVFVGLAQAIKAVGVAKDGGWTRLVVEKPFGRDLSSSDSLSAELGALFDESYMYRIDHYLGKEMVQNLLVMRFANALFEPVWNRQHIDCVYITFKEPFGTEGRGGYFDEYGIIRDVMQNHLMQILTLVAMEPPIDITDGDSVRDQKVKVLRSMSKLEDKDTVLGQYVKSADGQKPGYKDDDSLKNKNSKTPTFASIVMYVHNPRWDGVPFIMRAGKALDQRKVDVRVQFKPVPGIKRIFPDDDVDRNEFVIRFQPNEAMWWRLNAKAPGKDTHPVLTELDLTYKDRYGDYPNPDAYERMLFNVLRGNQSTFVRNDELRYSWQLFTPLLHRIEAGKIDPIPYEYGSRGPPEADALAIRVGYDEKSLAKRLAAGPRDHRPVGGGMSQKEKSVYLQPNPSPAASPKINRPAKNSSSAL